MEKYRFVAKLTYYALIDVEAESVMDAKRRMNKIVCEDADLAVYDVLCASDDWTVNYEYVGLSSECRPEADATVKSEGMV